jgi:hypothetical protein
LPAAQAFDVAVALPVPTQYPAAHARHALADAAPPALYVPAAHGVAV